MRLLHLILTSISASCAACLPPDTNIELTGSVAVMKAMQDDGIVVFKNITLDSATCFLADKVFSDEDKTIRSLQLVVPNTLEVKPGLRYKLSGQAFHWHTANHYTEVIFSVLSAQKI